MRKFEVKKQKAFTLVELMTVVAILGILMAIAYPSYTEHVKKAKRADAMAALVLAAAAYERYRTSPPYSYNVKIEDIFANQVPVEGGTKYYEIKNDGATSDGAYKIVAKAVGGMAGDGDLSITSTGEKKWGSKTCWPESASSCS